MILLLIHYIHYIYPYTFSKDLLLFHYNGSFRFGVLFLHLSGPYIIICPRDIEYNFFRMMLPKLSGPLIHRLSQIGEVNLFNVTYLVMSINLDTELWHPGYKTTSFKMLDFPFSVFSSSSSFNSWRFSGNIFGSYFRDDLTI